MLALEINKYKGFFSDRRKIIQYGLLILVLGLGIYLRFYNLGSGGVGNDYYAAAVKSMLMSWKNFFFVAFELGGSVSIDKPPLGFWIQCLSAYFLGVNGFALALPNALAGVFSIFVMYHLLKSPFGYWPALTGAMALAVMPVTVATERNNTIDGLLVFVLLLAAWAFIKAVGNGKIRWLFLGMVFVGLGFNIKMLQAFLPLPAFYALYFFGLKHFFWKKCLHLGLATLILIVVSFSWATIVDLTPASERPYVDSTSGNSAYELIFGHNGIERFTNNRAGGPGSAGNGLGMIGQPSVDKLMAQTSVNGSLSDQMTTGLQRFVAQNGSSAIEGLQNPGMQGSPGGPGGGGGGSMDFGRAGTFRLFTSSLAGEASWLLPFVLVGLILCALFLWKKPSKEAMLGLILWACWLIPQTLYFTYSEGTMHGYYLIMMGPPIAGLTAATVWAVWHSIRLNKYLGWTAAFILSAGSLVFQGYILWGSTSWAILSLSIAGFLFLSGFLLAGISLFQIKFSSSATALIISSLLVGPLTWSLLTTYNTSMNQGMPSAGPSQQGRMGSPGGSPAGNMPLAMNGGQPSMQAGPDGNDNRTMRPNGQGGGNGGVNQSLITFLLENTEPGTYLVSTGGAKAAAGYILATGRPVLALGGFLGQYEEFSLDQFTTLVTNGRLRFVLGNDLDNHQTISQWVKQNCSLVQSRETTGNNDRGLANGEGPFNSILYDCGK